jgi:acetyltransferase-like isoleucine patch superfamily enzyme
VNIKIEVSYGGTLMKKEVNMIHPHTRIGKNTKIGIYSVVGYPENEEKYVEIGQNCKIGNHVTIYPGTKIMNNVSIRDYSCIEKNAQIGNNVFISNYAHIGKNVMIGDSTLVLYEAKIYDGTKIGKHSRIGGFVAENTVIGEHVTVFGRLIHSFRDPTHWSGGEEPPTIDNFVVVGFNAIVIGAIKISHHVYIAAGAVVSKDVPPYSMVLDVNKIIHIKNWCGRIKKSKFWEWEG